jgi:hypothetical protein
MSTPPNERQSLEQELAELPKQIAAYRQELADTPALPEFKASREAEAGLLPEMGARHCRASTGWWLGKRKNDSVRTPACPRSFGRLLRRVAPRPSTPPANAKACL